jgi:hypothetical protein
LVAGKDGIWVDGHGQHHGMAVLRADALHTIGLGTHNRAFGWARL